MGWRSEVDGLGEALAGQVRDHPGDRRAQAVRCLHGVGHEADGRGSDAEAATVLVVELAKTVDDASRDTLLELRLRTRLRGVAVENEVELPSNVSGERLDLLVRGFVLSLGARGSDDGARARNQEPQETVHAMKIGGVSFCQPSALRQWHANACGFHALFNAVQLVDPEPTIKIGEEDFWCETLRWLRVLHRYNNVAKRWSASGLRSVTLDQMQIAYLIDTDARLRGRVGVYGSLEQVMAVGHELPRACVVGCVTHWVAVALHNESQTIWFAESFDKTCLQFTSAYEGRDRESEELEDSLVFADPRGLADAVMDDYHPKFIAKLRSSHVSYANMPAEILEDYYENGVPEYWKGKEKNSLYWQHRPREMRVFLLIQEIEAVAALMDHLYEYIEAGKRAACPERVLEETARAVETDLGAWCAEQPEPEHASAALAPGFVRRDQDWDPESEEYKSGRTVEHRKKPPPPEVAGDIFDRQRVMVDFDQSLVERQVCLVVGTGGVGQNTALTLARLGVECIILLDYDKVDASNLTRQCLSSRADVGVPKVDAARDNLLRQHNLRSTVLTMDGDVLANWPSVVELARMSTVIFNCADVGVMFDYCIASLGKELGVPVATGQSFAWKFMTEVYSGAAADACAFCQETTRSSFGIQNVPEIFARWQTFVDARAARGELDDDLVDLVCAFMEQDRQFRMRGPGTRAAVQEALEDIEAASADDLDSEDALKSFFECVHTRVMSRLRPGEISRATDVLLVPRPKLPETRFFGSWVCPCLASGTMMVSHWLNMLTGPTAKNPPTNVVFNLDEGMTSEEQMSYELGFGLSKEDRGFAHSPSSEACSLCESAVLLHARADLFFGTCPAWLKPAQGRVFPVPQFLDQDEHFASPTDKRGTSSGGGGRTSGPDLVEPRLPARPATMLASSAQGYEIMAPKALTTTPLVKCSEEEAATEPSALRCSASGVRSAVVRLHNRAYRLKGCGNNGDGFVIEARGDNGEEMVRGCLFANTASTEMRMSEKVRDVLAPVGIRAGNVPVCFFKYETPHLPAEAECFCNVYETLGDRRLGDHLLAGLELLMPSLCGAGSASQIASMKRAVLQARGMDGDEVWDTATMTECGMPVCDMRELVSISLTPLDPKLSSHALWGPAVLALGDALQRASDGPSVLLQLAYVLGWQCGVTCAALARAGISWGTYPDDTGVHCNAHANNMVVLDVVAERDEVLAPVDFDMAFTSEAFDPEILEQAHQKLFPREWADLVAMEQQMGMRTSLAGSDFTSTGVSNMAAQAFAESEYLTLTRAVFRDTIVSAFDAALEADKAHAADTGFSDSATADAARALIVLSLILTKDTNA